MFEDGSEDKENNKGKRKIYKIWRSILMTYLISYDDIFQTLAPPFSFIILDVMHHMECGGEVQRVRLALHLFSVTDPSCQLSILL